MTATLAAPPRSYAGLFGNREYVGLLVSRVVSLVGDQLARVALTVLVYSRTGSTLLSALTYVASLLPTVVGGPLLGGLADRTAPRRLLIAVDLARGGLYGLMALNGLPVTVLLLLLVVATAISSPWGAARQTVMRDVLVDSAGYQRGSGLDQTLAQVGQVLGFGIGGLLLVVLRPSTALLLDAASFAFSAVVARVLLQARAAAAVAPPVERRVARALDDARTGWRAALSPACRRPLLLTWIGFACSVTPEGVAGPWAAHLGGGSIALGLILAANPVGSVMGLLLVGRLPPELSGRLVVPLALATMLPLVACLLDPPLPVVLGLVLVSGACSSFNLLARVAFVRGLAAGTSGRAFSVAAAGVTGFQGIGLAVAGAAAAGVGAPAAVGLVAAFGLVMIVGVTTRWLR